MAVTSAFANTNQQFADQVQSFRHEMAHNDSAVVEAALLCANLAATRAMDEPKCVAWRLHVRALSDKARTETCGGGGLSAIGHIQRCVLGGLAGSAA